MKRDLTEAHEGNQRTAAVRTAGNAGYAVANRAQNCLNPVRGNGTYLSPKGPPMLQGCLYCKERRMFTLSLGRGQGEGEFRTTTALVLRRAPRRSCSVCRSALKHGAKIQTKFPLTPA